MNETDETDDPSRHDVSITINGRRRRVGVDAGATLLHSVRDEFELTGAKPVCEVGTCGACTMLLDDEAVYSCLVLTAECDGRSVDTVEGLGGVTPSELQRAFADCDALQCGFCTAGQLMSLEGLRRCEPAPTNERIERAIEGNLCRCGAYRHILEAAERALTIRSRT
ncbi:MAG: (2Fe-2S)-binding protein [Ilumatobacter sp.]|uniref:(2Fe-2S)-binding protein n=1 Tax=Ilumatobacter sp. TaxID=1967498 RepID=UPI003C76FE3C